MYWNFYSSLGDRELLYFVCLPLRGERGNWKKLSLSCGIFHSLLVAFRNSKTRRHSEIKQTRPSTKQDFSGEALSKQNTEASLASLACNSSRAMTEFMQRVTGADRMVRHICIRCMQFLHCIKVMRRLWLVYLTIIPWARVGYEMVNSQRGP